MIIKIWYLFLVVEQAYTPSVSNDLVDFKKLKSTSLVFGSQGVNSLDAVPALAFDMLGLDVNVVYGMKGRKVGRAAILRGETTIDYQTTASYLKHVKPLVEKGEMVAESMASDPDHSLHFDWSAYIKPNLKKFIAW